ncbi:DUF1330 domain-containing protein [Pacificoceanicola onchidii]|uniref:DUF1330 domain-containing protein n=1 Tax=Pacificoceanicola onchidii TaxID=2562685 RepID=UPI0010A4CA90|nr:DUF1330 domain-containing protein [Pacificoceanicola onchidii]
MIYAVVELTISDQASFDAYAKQAGAALVKYGAKPEAMSTEPTQIEGAGAAPGRMVLLSFPDKAAALGWIEDPELREVHALRRASGDCRIRLIG